MTDETFCTGLIIRVEFDLLVFKLRYEKHIGRSKSLELAHSVCSNGCRLQKNPNHIHTHSLNPLH